MASDYDVGDEAFRSFMPISFGKGDKGVDIDAQIERTRRKVPEPSIKRKQSQSSQDSDESDGDSEESEEEDEYPVSHELVFKTHDRAVTSISIDPAGSRMITGSTDCTVKLYDFASMTPTTLRAFKTTDPTASKSSAASQTHPIHLAQFNPNAPSQVLILTATPQARLMSRDGDMEGEFMKGDMYLRDMHMTKGHISEITSGAWHPTNWEFFATTGTDSTIRIWDVNAKMKQKDVIVHKSKAAGLAGRARMTAVAWGSSAEGTGSLLVSAALDGSLLMWNGDGPYNRPLGEVRDAHVAGTWTSGIDISSDGRLIVTRGGDDTIKLWDTRKFKQPISTTSHTSTSSQYPTTNILFSPNASSVITGSETGDLYILNPATLRPDIVTPITPGSPLVAVFWHEKLNQIVTGSANGETHVLFNPKLSTKGALMILSKAPKRRHVDDDPSFTTDVAEGVSGDSVVAGGTINPGASYSARHPTIGLTASGRSRDPRRPHLPNTTPFAKSQPDEEHIRKSIPLSSMREEDPREALLKYAEKAEKDPMFTNAWKETQPKTIYADLSDEEEQTPERKKIKR
ncbi:putative wd repeat protein [Phaeomoniella chlamydospora]|uniref:Putative wd repeat protein n=1 Tax=Phaeomoniella chlamydospora TaxID=158046 RepID=A0A0G2EKJ9_PHACM|nr:putative wd repeat protein [Phaeomoniella chlamydospora]